MPHNDATEVAGECEVIERPALSGSESVWQAEIEVKYEGPVNGRQRSFTIRGPPRKSQAQGEADKKELDAHRHEGAKALRTLANKMHRA